MVNFVSWKDNFVNQEDNFVSRMDKVITRRHGGHGGARRWDA